MTICIAALASSHKNGRPDCVVIASDRMVTLGSFMEFEHHVPKVAQISANTFALMAGDALRGSLLVRQLEGTFANAQPPVGQVAQAAGQMYHQTRMTAVDQEVLQPRGIALQNFNTGQQHQLLPQLAFSLAQDIANFNLNVDLIITGVDQGGGHIFTVHNPGLKFDDHEQIGFSAIGSGAIHAMQAFIALEHTKAKSLEEAIFNVYAAKRRAEVAPGVGKETDMLIVAPTGVLVLDETHLATLDKTYDDAMKPAHDKIIAQMKKLNLVPPPAPAENPKQETGDADQPSEKK